MITAEQMRYKQNEMKAIVITKSLKKVKEITKVALKDLSEILEVMVSDFSKKEYRFSLESYSKDVMELELLCLGLSQELTKNGYISQYFASEGYKYIDVGWKDELK